MYFNFFFWFCFVLFLFFLFFVFCFFGDIDILSSLLFKILYNLCFLLTLLKNNHKAATGDHVSHIMLLIFILEY